MCPRDSRVPSGRPRRVKHLAGFYCQVEGWSGKPASTDLPPQPASLPRSVFYFGCKYFLFCFEGSRGDPTGNWAKRTICDSLWLRAQLGEGLPTPGWSWMGLRKGPVRNVWQLAHPRGQLGGPGSNSGKPPPTPRRGPDTHTGSAAAPRRGPTRFKCAPAK